MSAEALSGIRQVLGDRGKHRFNARQWLYRVYVIGLFGLLAVGILAVNVTAELPPLSATALPWVRAGLPTVVLLTILAAFRAGTWFGVVSLARAEAAWLLPMPLPRATLTRPRLLVTAAVLSLAGALAGALVTWLFANAVVTRPWQLAASAVGAGGLTGIGITGGTWFITRRPIYARKVLSWSPLAITAALGAGAAAYATDPGWLIWSGPWGWASAGVLDALGVSVPGWPWALVLLSVLCGGVFASALATADHIGDEELYRRAGLHSGARAALFLFELRSLALRRRLTVRRLNPPRLVRVPSINRQWLVPWWVVLVQLIRVPGRAWWLTASTVAVPLGIAAWGLGVVTITLLVVTGYGLASSLLEPLRTEMQVPGALWQLPLSRLRLLLPYVALPAVAIGLAGTVGALLLPALGLQPLGQSVGLAVAAFMAAPVLVACAGVAARAGQPAFELLATGYLGTLYASLLLIGPLLALGVVWAPALIVTALPVTAVTWAVPAILAVATAVLTPVLLLRNWPS